LERLSHGSLSARIYEVLRSALMAGDYEPAERLKMQDLALELGTSVTPVREACLRLVSEGALELRSGRFITVPELTRERYWQVRLIRIALETLATRLAAERANESDITQLRTLHESFVKSEKAGQADKARRDNQQFHFHVYRLSGMDLLMGQIESMWASMGPILNVYYRQIEHDYVGADEHLQIIEGLATGNGELAAAAVERDIIRGGLNLLRYFDQQGLALNPPIAAVS